MMWICIGVAVSIGWAMIVWAIIRGGTNNNDWPDR